MNMLDNDGSPNIRDDHHDFGESLNTKVPDLDLDYENHENEMAEVSSNPKNRLSKTAAVKDGPTTK